MPRSEIMDLVIHTQVGLAKMSRLRCFLALTGEWPQGDLQGGGGFAAEQWDRSGPQPLPDPARRGGADCYDEAQGTDWARGRHAGVPGGHRGQQPIQGAHHSTGRARGTAQRHSLWEGTLLSTPVSLGWSRLARHLSHFCPILRVIGVWIFFQGVYDSICQMLYCHRAIFIAAMLSVYFCHSWYHSSTSHRLLTFCCSWYFSWIGWKL